MAARPLPQVSLIVAGKKAESGDKVLDPHLHAR
jgi:hypothetical protein